MIASRMLFFVCAFCSSAISSWTEAEAGTFVEVLLQARANDPEYLGAVADVSVAHSRHRQAMAELLPQLDANVTINKVNREYNTLNTPLGDQKEKSNFQAENGEVNFTLPVWRPASRSAEQQARTAITEREQHLLAAEHTLVVRLAQRLFDAMAARDEWLRSDAEASLAFYERKQAVQAASIQLVGAPKLEEVRAKYDLALAEKTAAMAEREAKIAALEEITGALPDFKAPYFVESFRIPAVELDSLPELIERIEATSPIVNASRFALDAADHEVAKQKAAFLPTMDLVATYSHNEQETGNFPGQSGYDIQQRSVGLQFKVPLVSGGAQSARVSEALALRSKAEHELRGTIRTAVATGKTAWLTLQATSARESAALQAVKSTKLSLQSARAGMQTELSSEFEMLRAQAELSRAWRDLQRSRYDATLNWLKLKASVGELTEADLRMVDAFLKNTNSLELLTSR